MFKQILLLSSGVYLVLSSILFATVNSNFNPDKCPYGSNYNIECIDCSCNSETGTTECTDAQCIHLEDKCPNGTKFEIGCSNLCYCNRITGDTICTVIRCRKKYQKYLAMVKM